MTGECGIQTFLGQHVQSLAQAKDHMFRRGAGEPAVGFGTDHAAALPIPIAAGAAAAGGVGDPSGLLANRIETQADGAHQAFLRTANGDIHAPLVHTEIGAGKRSDDIGNQQSIMAGIIYRLAYGRDVRGNARRGFRMHHQDGAVFTGGVRAQAFLDFIRVDGVAPIRWNRIDGDAQLFRHGRPSKGKQSGFRHQNLVARREDIGECRFPGAVAVGGINEDLFVGLEDGADIQKTFPGQFDKIRAGIFPGRLMHGAQDPLGNIGWSRRLQKISSPSYCHVVDPYRSNDP